MSKLTVFLTSICISTPVILGSLLPFSQVAEPSPVQVAAQETPAADEKKDLPKGKAIGMVGYKVPIFDPVMVKDSK